MAILLAHAIGVRLPFGVPSRQSHEIEGISYTAAQKKSAVTIT